LGFRVYRVDNNIKTFRLTTTKTKRERVSMKMYLPSPMAYLEKVEALAESDNSLLGIIFASHPVPMKRIDRLERE
jgi:Zn-dependent protease with chaperone function